MINQSDYKIENNNKDIPKNYLDGTPFNLDINNFKDSIYDYLSNIAAVDLISTKNIDALVCENSKFSKDKTKEFNTYLKDQFLEKKIYHVAKQVALKGYSCIFLQPSFLTKYKYFITTNLEIIKLERVQNLITYAEFLLQIGSGIATTPIYALVKVDEKSYKTQFYSFKNDNTKMDEEIKSKNNDLKKENEIELAELQIKLGSDYANFIFNSLNQDHNLGFIPIFVFSMNDHWKPLIWNIENDLNELFALAQKTYDEAHFMGTKVKAINSNMSDPDANDLQARNYQRIIASSCVLYSTNLFNENGDPQVDVLTKQPVWQILNDAFKQKINFILKKIGISSDTDSKGTVQQSISEVIRQNEYSYNNQNYRNLILQNFLQDMLSKIYQANFNEQDEIKVISSQSLGMSEFEKLNYVITAKQNNLMDDAHAYSIISGKNYIESLELIELFNLNNADRDIQNQNENFNLDQEKNQNDEIEEGIENEKEQEENI